MNPLKKLVIDQKNGIKKGITSVCSANEFVLRAAIENAKKYNENVLIEATANQVNQFGGYTGMMPKDFAEFVSRIADECGFEKNKLILGGDHLGPLTWADESESQAMNNAKELVKQYVLAGFTKIHLDTSMHLKSDDRNIRLSDEKIARRGAELCLVCEQAFAERKKHKCDAARPVYVVGSEVPIPGGVQEKHETITVTAEKDIKTTITVFEKCFMELGLHDAWERVIAVVVQPGVEFGDVSIDEYNREAAKKLVKAMSDYPNLVLEGHSTDYQTKYKLRELVCDGVAVLKVGPALTFALREALFSLEQIEREIFLHTGIHLSNFKAILEEEMLKKPNNWKNHYHGGLNELEFKRMYSLSDRARYYLPNEQVDLAIRRLINNLSSCEISLALLSQYMPIQYTKVREGIIANDPVALLKDRIVNCLDEYGYACGRNENG